MISSKQAAVAVLIGLISKGKIPPVIWNEPMMREVLEGEWGEWKQDMFAGPYHLSAPYRRRTLERTAEFLTLPYYWVRMKLQAVQHESKSQLSTPLWEVRGVEILGKSGEVATTLTSAQIGLQCWIGGRASIEHLVGEFQRLKAPEAKSEIKF